MDRCPKKRAGLGALPEDCIAHLLSLTTPLDAARAAAVSRAFRSASGSDAVWRKFLPPDLDLIVSTSVPPPPPPPLGPSLTRKKDVFLRLCSDPLLIDSGRKSFSLDRHSGKKCIMLSARALSIIWGDTPIYWSWARMRNSRFAEVAKLIDVCWLEIRGTISSCMLSPGTHYAAYLVFKFTQKSYGFESQSVEVGAGFAGDEAGQRERLVFLSRKKNTHGRWSRHFMHAGGSLTLAPAEGNGNYPEKRRDGWSEIELGEFLTKDGDGGEVKMSVLETKGGHWKSGLVVEGIEIRPKHGK